MVELTEAIVTIRNSVELEVIVQSSELDRRSLQIAMFS